jgi:hypothetical protein
MRYTYKLKELAKELCDKSGCHHKCNDTSDCVVEDEALLLISENKSNNFDVKSNEELFKQALVEGVNRHIDKAIAEIKVITYEQDRLNHFIDCMEKAQKKYDRLYKRYKNSPYLFEGTTLLSDAGRELQFYKDVVAMLEQDNRKQSEGEWKKRGNEKTCSLCNFIYYSNNDEWNFCPNCGAKMKGGEE